MKRDSESSLELILSATGAGIWDLQIQSQEVSINQRWAEMIGYSLEELIPLTYSSWADKIHPEDMAAVEELIEKQGVGETELYQAEFRMRHKLGNYVWILSSGKVVEWQADGKPKRMLGTHVDISDRKVREFEIVLTTQLLNQSQQIAQVGGWELNVETGDLFWTDETYRIHDVCPDEFNPTVDAGVSYFLPESREIISAALDQAIQHGEGYDLELKTLTTKGRLIDVRTTCVVTTKMGKTLRLTGIFQDISDQKAIQRKLEKSNLDLQQANSALKLSAHYDSLTELPNRILLADRMQQAMTKSIRTGQSVGVAFIDLDGFKVINDTYGHSVGDQFLKLISKQLKQCLRDGDTLARLGGDEFVAIMDGINESQDSDEILTRMLIAAAEQVVVEGIHIKSSASIGVTFFPQNNNSPDQLLRCADQAMYQAKQLGKNRRHVFDVEKMLLSNIYTRSLIGCVWH